MRPTQPSANDNGPLTSGQVKALKIAIAVMSIFMVVALIAIIGRVLYMSSSSSTRAPDLIPDHTLSLPAGAAVKDMSVNNDQLLVHYQTATGTGALLVDLKTGKTLSRVKIPTATPAPK